MARCRCCLSNEALQGLPPAISDILRLITIPQDVKFDNYPTEACFQCNNFLKEIHQFRIKCQSIDEILRNNLDVENLNVDLIFKNAIENNSSYRHVKTELKGEYDGFDPINQMDMDLKIETTLEGQTDEKQLIVSLQCEKCSYKTHNKAHMNRHQRRHSSEERLSCNHTNKHCDEKPFICDQCGYRTTKKSYISAHIKRHIVGNDKSLKCGLCPYKSLVQRDLRYHVKHIHDQDKSFPCSKCDYHCKMRSQLVKHMKKHDRRFQCDRCTYECSKKYYLTIHMGMHDGERGFSCDLCDFICQSQSGLVNHSKNIH